MKYITNLPVLLTCATLAACGGGGGDPANLLQEETGVQLAAGTVHCAAEPGLNCAQFFSAQAANGQSERNFVWSEEASVKVVGDLEKEKQADGSWRMKISFRDNLPPGEYSGRVKIDLMTYPVSSLTVYNPSWLNYRFSVGPSQGQITALQKRSDDWQGFQGNAAHNAALNLNLEPTRISRRYTLSMEDNVRLNGLVSSNGKIFLSRSTNNGNLTQRSIQALREHDGSLLWELKGGTARFGQLAANGSDIAFLQYDEKSGRSLRTYNAENGQARLNLPLPYSGLLSSDNPMAPVLEPQEICAASGRDEEVECRDLQSGALRLALPTRGALDPRYIGWTPALNSSHIFTNLHGQFKVFAKADGALQYTLDVPGPRSGALHTSHELNQAPVLADSQSAVLLDRRASDGSARENTISVIDLERRAIRWQVNGAFVQHPVAAKGVVYAGNHKTGQVEARDLQTGKLLWGWKLAENQESGFGPNLIVLNNALLVAGKDKTWALDSKDGRVLWSYPIGGQLAISAQGLLYILGQREGGMYAPRAHLLAFNLQ